MPTLCLSKQDQGGSTRPAKVQKENVMAGGDIGNIGTACDNLQAFVTSTIGKGSLSGGLKYFIQRSL